MNVETEALKKQIKDLLEERSLLINVACMAERVNHVWESSGEIGVAQVELLGDAIQKLHRQWRKQWPYSRSEGITDEDQIFNTLKNHGM